MSERFEGAEVLLPVLALVIIVGAGVLDYGLYRARLITNRTFDSTLFFTVTIGGNLLLSSTFVTGAWVAARARRLRPLVGIVLLLLGLPVAFYIPLRFAGIGLPLRAGFWHAEYNFMFTGAFVVVLGIYALLKSRRAGQDE